MEFRLLGPLEARNGEGVQVSLPRRQQRALLAALLVRVGEVVSTDRLIDDLWGEDPPLAAKGALQNTVSQLRKDDVIGKERVRTQPPGYVLDVDPECVDSRRFERLLGEAIGHAPAERAAPLREALALWRGPALADLLDYFWAEQEAARLEELRLGAIEHLIDAELDLGHHAAVVPQLETLIVEHRFRERLWRQRALALYRCGRQNEALAAIREIAAALDDTEGLEPTPELRKLERDILNQDPAIAAPVLAETEEAAPAAVAGERRVVSVVSVALADEDDPELLRAALDRLLAAANAAVPAHGGELEAFGTNGLSAVFGANGAHEDDALRAVRAAFAIHEATGAPAGVATGDAVIAEQPRVAGAAVRRAAGLAQLHQGVLADPRTFELVRHAVTAERSGPVARILTVAPERPQPGLESRLVGRTDELAVLREAFAAAAEERRCRTVTVLGEAGIGKTRLARELVSALDATVLVGRCAAYGEGATFLPVVEALRDVDVPTALAEDDDAELVAARIDALAGAAPAPATMGESYWAVRRVLEGLVRARPGVVVLDDVHWAEPALLDLCEYLRDRVDAPLLVLCLARPELLDDRPNWASDALRLQALAADETLELVDETAALESDARWRIVELAEGNPLYAQQLATFAAESGKALEAGAMPASIEAVLAGRLGRLDAGERATLQRAAVVGREFSRGAVAALAPPDLAVDAHLLALARRGFVRAAREVAPGDDAYRFHHVLLRDAAYATLTRDQRADLHERVAAWLDRDGPGDDALVGYHLEQAAQLREAPAVAEAAGRRLGDAGYRAGARGDTRAALGLLRRAVDLLPTGERRGQLLWELAIALWIAGRGGEAETALAEGSADADARGDRRLAARWTVQRALVDLSRGSAAPGDVLAAATDALVVLEAANDTRGQGRAWNAIVSARNYRGEMALMGEAAANAEACALAIGFSTAASIGSQAAALNHGPTPALDALSACLGLLKRARDRAGEANVLAALAALHAQLGRDRDALDCLQASALAYDEVGLGLARETTWAHSAFDVHRLSGRVEEAAETGRRSIDALLAMANPAYASTRAVQVADLHVDLGESADAVTMVKLAKRHVSKHDLLVGLMVRRVEARLAARAGDHARAETLAQRAVRDGEASDLLCVRGDTHAVLAEILAASGRPEEAAAAATAADELYERKGAIAARERTRLVVGTPPFA